MSIERTETWGHGLVKVTRDVSIMGEGKEKFKENLRGYKRPYNRATLTVIDSETIKLDYSNIIFNSSKSPSNELVLVASEVLKGEVINKERHRISPIPRNVLNTLLGHTAYYTYTPGFSVRNSKK